MKKYKFLFVLILLSKFASTQVPKKVVVEHFTNTKCSICATRNPGFYSNYNAQVGVIHLAIHPSAPYSACALSMHNPSENDARTNYYGVYGSTPRLVIQGVVISTGANYAATTLFSPYLAQTSPASIRIVQSKFGNDSIQSRILIKTEASHTLPGLSLFVALAEDTINYTGSNGETVHYDVFRKSLTGASGINVTLPQAVGDSVLYTLSSPVNGAWNFSRIYTLAILQETVSKAVVQAQSVTAKSNNNTIGILKYNALNVSIKAFVTNYGIEVNQDNFSEKNSFTLYDGKGRALLTKILTRSTETIPLSEISSGVYLYSIKDKNATVIKTGKLFFH